MSEKLQNSENNKDPVALGREALRRIRAGEKAGGNIDVAKLVSGAGELTDKEREELGDFVRGLRK